MRFVAAEQPDVPRPERDLLAKCVAPAAKHVSHRAGAAALVSVLVETVTESPVGLVVTAAQKRLARVLARALLAARDPAERQAILDRVAGASAMQTKTAGDTLLHGGYLRGWRRTITRSIACSPMPGYCSKAT